MSSSDVQATEHDPQGPREFAVPCVFVLRVRDGQIVESRDYVDHFAFAEASGMLDSLPAG
ncbi:hypothetical protein [Saccharopolyspora sp. ASAGF58]|uniref:hypothetical protein n=1 Tax=Saccharopolyspora sp. ASAGF58 TaxID=2719023 RepID=UPI00144027B1|nr:hypothetical protein [Saccharopolyspora sp. ASAGF58]QIZ34633.1 hypothetical protein FDZ84_07690 [Saccharopolyspora sp. ASAGF58]